MKSGAVATRDQPVPIGLALLSHQIRQNPDSNFTTEKSARAGVDAAKPSANTPTAKTKRFIASSPCRATPELSDSTCLTLRQAHLVPFSRLINRCARRLIAMEESMPEVVVYLLEGRTLEQKRGLVKDITQAVVKNAGATADQVTVSLVETPKTAKAKGGVLFSEMAGR
jgi:4-oxalocrotonate tautomerase